jgi:hypothetical protein
METGQRKPFCFSIDLTPKRGLGFALGQRSNNQARQTVKTRANG